ncbi:MAG TPA: TlpA disulfide reductase family protein [Chloroflexota bacterium]
MIALASVRALPRWARRFLVSLLIGWMCLMAALAALVLWPSAGAPHQTPSLPGLRLGATTPDFTLTDTGGTSVHLAALRGRRVLINFWSPTCPPCVTEMPLLERAWSEGRQVGLGAAPAVLGVVGTADSRATIAAFGRRVGARYPLLVDPVLQVSLLDYHVGVLPTSVVLDPRGRLVSVYFGPLTLPEMRRALGISR